ncbi:hypothetical protein ACQP1P_22765 [Dactylosporangium sp. CA-052675]|uniref:hypothetical protein n=1 Tax=Dactylosporangium sp. CA-052675 TaxID=3239927 RepID=UPI003D8E52C4
MTEYCPRAAVLRLSQHLAAGGSVAAVTGVGPPAPASLAGHRTAQLHGAQICPGLIVLAPASTGRAPIAASSSAPTGSHTSCTTLAPPVRVREQPTTSHPRPASTSTSAAPSPRPAPVTTARRLS